MTDYQDAQLKMFLEVSNFFDTTDFINTNNVLKGHVEKLNVLIAGLEQNKNKQEADLSGYTQEKQEAKAELAKTIFAISAGVRSFATDTNNDPLYNEFKLTEVYINKLSDVNIVSYATNLSIEIAKYPRQLIKYGINRDDVIELQTKTYNYSKLLLKPAEHKKEKAVATKNIKKILSNINKLLKTTIDNDMVQYEETNPDLYEKYLKLREIDDSITRALSLKGKVTDANTTEALQYVEVKVEIKINRKPQTFKTETTVKGNYQFKGLPEGKCSVNFSKDYYQTKTIASEIHHGKLTKINIKLEKEIN